MPKKSDSVQPFGHENRVASPREAPLPYQSAREQALTYPSCSTQTTACNSLHLLDQRLARWLLEVQDRIDSDDLKLTQEFIAHMLGVRRAGVTQAAQKLQQSGLIRYQRGHVKILDQRGLEAFSCQCFMTLREEYDRLLGAKKRDR